MHLGISNFLLLHFVVSFIQSDFRVASEGVAFPPLRLPSARAERNKAAIRSLLKFLPSYHLEHKTKKTDFKYPRED